jgi:hypothetical protein
MADQPIAAGEACALAAFLMVQQLLREIASLDEVYHALATGVIEDAAIAADQVVGGAGSKAADLIRSTFELDPFIEDG